MYPENKYLSPTGAYVFHTEAWEIRMSHWIESFTLVETALGSLVFRIHDSNWSLDKAQWLDESRVRMELRKYPGDHTPASFQVLIDCEAKRAEVMGKPAIPLQNLEQALEKLYRESRLSGSA